MKWKKRSFVEDAPMGPKNPRSTILTQEEEAACLAFRKHTLLPLDDCLYALQSSIPHLTRSSLHRLFQRHEISRLPDVEGNKLLKKKFNKYPIGYFHADFLSNLVKAVPYTIHTVLIVKVKMMIIEDIFMITISIRKGC